MIARLIVKTTSLFLLAALLFSCSDDIPNVGGDMMPDGDKINMFAEQVSVTARTVSIDPDLYLRSNSAILGSIEDPLLGTTKSDFMGQFFVANPRFNYGYKGLDDVTIDSVRMIMAYPYTSYTGDFEAPMGITVYALSEQLTPNFYMSVDPSTYCNKDTILGERYFTQDELPLKYSSPAATYFRTLEIDMEQNIGQRIFDQWKSDTLSGKPAKETVLYNTNTFKEFMKGIYVTTTFNNKSMINFSDINASLYMNIHYSYNIKNKAGSADSLLSDKIQFPIGAEALHLNSVQSTKYEDMAIYNSTDTDRTYIKALSGVVTEVTIPLKEIREKGKAAANTESFTLNSALLSFVGMTEKEEDLKFTGRPSYLLFVNADSISNYFLDGIKPNGLTSQVLTRSSSNNTYYFNSGLSASTTTPNFAVLINQYLQNNPELDVVKYYLIPVDITTELSGYSTYIISGVSNSYTPSAAILRTSEEYLKVPLVFSKFANNK